MADSVIERIMKRLAALAPAVAAQISAYDVPGGSR